MNLNLVQVCGRLTRKPELKTTQGGTVVCNFSVATNRKWTGTNGEKKEETEFHNVVAFGKTAENVEKWFGKGDEIYIQGRLKTSSWEDPQSRQKKYKTDIIADRFDFGQKSRKNEQPHTDREPDNLGMDMPPEDSNQDEINVDSIPF